MIFCLACLRDRFCAAAASWRYQISQSTSPPSFRCRASRSLITPRLVLMIRDSQSAEHRFQFGRAAVDAAARLADAADRRITRSPLGPYFRCSAELLGGFHGNFLPIPDVAFALEHFGQAALHLGQAGDRRAAFRRAPRCGCGSTCRRWGRSSWSWVFLLPARLAGRRESLPRPLGCESRSDKFRTSGRRPAAGRKAGSAAPGAWKTSAAAGPWPSSIYLPCIRVLASRYVGVGATFACPQRHAHRPQQLARPRRRCRCWSPG